MNISSDKTLHSAEQNSAHFARWTTFQCCHIVIHVQAQSVTGLPKIKDFFPSPVQKALKCLTFLRKFSVCRNCSVIQAGTTLQRTAQSLCSFYSWQGLADFFPCSCLSQNQGPNITWGRWQQKHTSKANATAKFKCPISAIAANSQKGSNKRRFEQRIRIN